MSRSAVVNAAVCGGAIVPAAVRIKMNDFNVRRFVRRLLRRSAAVPVSH
jgi:hypothetical protein